MKKIITSILIFLIILLIGGLLLFKISEGLKIHIKNNTDKDISGLQILYIDKYKNVIKTVDIPNIQKKDTYILKNSSPNGFIESHISIGYCYIDGTERQEPIAIFIDDGAAKSNVYVEITSIDASGNLSLKISNDFHY